MRAAQIEKPIALTCYKPLERFFWLHRERLLHYGGKPEAQHVCSLESQVHETWIASTHTLREALGSWQVATWTVRELEVKKFVSNIGF